MIWNAVELAAVLVECLITSRLIILFLGYRSEYCKIWKSVSLFITLSFFDWLFTNCLHNDLLFIIALFCRRFQLLSPCMRQVTHALLTRPPLSHKIFISEENQIECFVRLACVKHAASVHPEPGSNSHVKKFCPARIKSGF